MLSSKSDIRPAWCATVQGKLLLKVVSVGCHGLKKWECQLQTVMRLQWNAVGHSSFDQLLIERLGWEVSVFVFWTASRTHTKYVVSLCLSNSSNWSRVITDLSGSLWTLTKQPRVSSQAQSLLEIIDFNLYSWFNVISLYIFTIVWWWF